MSALLAVLAGTSRLSRRDRAALTLALECVRGRADSSGVWPALSSGDGDGVAFGLYDVCRGADVRLIGERRARLALLLRLVLRCDAWTRADEDWCEWPMGCSPWWQPRRCSRCGHRVSQLEIGDVVKTGKCCGARVERVVPLWEQAPATRAR